MRLYWIDEDDEGWYRVARDGSYNSRRQAAEERQYIIACLGNSLYNVQRPGGVTHQVFACRSDGILTAGCDCYDFSAYGGSFNRACEHIWAVVLNQGV